MQISSRFTIAVHMLVCMETFKEQYKITSDFLASSIKDAGLIEVKRGTGGAAVTRPLEQVTFLDVYRAVECIGENTLFHFHENPNQKCPVGKNIHNILDDRLRQVQELQTITLADMMKDLDRYLGKQEG